MARGYKLLFNLIVLGLVACTHVQKPNPECQANCLQKLAICKKVCVDSCVNCLNKGYRKSVKHYSRYVGEKIIQGGMVTRDLNSYRDPLQCRKVTCSCSADYYACSQVCGGVIRKQLRPATGCVIRF
jgi:hypothetical protein